MNGLLLDLRYALRSLSKSPAYFALCVAALALGIGANGAIFSLVHTLMLRPLPYPQPERLMLPHISVEQGRAALGVPERFPWSYPKLQTFLGAQTVFEDVAGFSVDSVNLLGGAEPERLQMEMVGPAYFSILGVRPIRGRDLAAADGARGAPLVAVVGEGLWRRRFGSDPSLVGRDLRLGNVPVTVVGIAPAGFAGLTGEAELWVPVTAAERLWYPEVLDEVGNHWLDAVGRLRPGVAPERLAAEMDRIGRLMDVEHPMPAEVDDGSVWGAAATPLAEARRDPFVRRALVVLLAAVGSVLLIACANLASLAMVRASRRRRELAVRLAIGASPGRLVRQSLVESLVLAGAGAIAGLAAAFWLVRGLASLRPEAFGSWGVGSSELGDLSTAGVGLPVVLFCLGIAVVTALLFGVAPAVRAARLRPSVDLRQGGASVAGHRGFGAPRAGGARPLLVAVQMALALVTLVGAGLLIRSLWALQSVELGFAPERVLTFTVNPSSGDYADEGAGPAMHARLLDRLRALPGVEMAAVGSCMPATGESGCNSTVVLSVDGVEVPRAAAPSIGWHLVSEDYFRTLGIRLRAGRVFDGRDRRGARRVVVLNETAARLLWPGESALGRRLQLGTAGLNGEVHGEVVGVVADARYRRLEDAPAPEAYLPDLQTGYSSTRVFLRAAGDPLALVPAVRAAVRSVDPNLPVYRLRTLEEQLGLALGRARFASLLLAAFALAALALAALGVYGVLAQSVAARRREIGLRMALGAAAGEVERLVLRQGMTMAVAGALVGTALALALSGLLRGLLYEVPARDPLTFAAVPLALLGVAALACLIPARRAARVDPTVVLRQE